MKNLGLAGWLVACCAAESLGAFLMAGDCYATLKIPHRVDQRLA